MAASIHHRINSFSPEAPCDRVLNDNAADLEMARSGPNASFRAMFLAMMAHVVHDSIVAKLLTVSYTPSSDSPAGQKGSLQPSTRRPSRRPAGQSKTSDFAAMMFHTHARLEL
eukprot:7743560-Prorocentrum_lima.AAC.1